MDNNWYDNNNDSQESQSFDDNDFFGDEPESQGEVQEDSPQTPEPEVTTFLWKDLEDICNFSEKFANLTKKEHELMLSLLKNARITDPAFSIAKRLLEEESLSLLPMEIVEDAINDRMKSDGGELPLTLIVNLTTQIATLSTDSKHTLVKVANATLPGSEIKWRNNIPDNTLAEKFLERIKKIDPSNKEANPAKHFKSVQEILKLWPGSRG